MICNQKTKMKLVFLWVSILFSTATYAESLAVVASYMSCIGKNEIGLLQYKASLIVKNIGKENLTLITKTDGATVATVDGALSQIILSRGGADLIYDDTVLIVPESDLGLVELYPEEGVEISDVALSSKPIEGKVIIRYAVLSVFGGRHKNWEGVIEAKPRSIVNSENCTL